MVHNLRMAVLPGNVFGLTRRPLTVLRDDNVSCLRIVVDPNDDVLPLVLMTPDLLMQHIGVQPGPNGGHSQPNTVGQCNRMIGS